MPRFILVVICPNALKTSVEDTIEGAKPGAANEGFRMTNEGNPVSFDGGKKMKFRVGCEEETVLGLLKIALAKIRGGISSQIIDNNPAAAARSRQA